MVMEGAPLLAEERAWSVSYPVKLTTFATPQRTIKEVIVVLLAREKVLLILRSIQEEDRVSQDSTDVRTQVLVSCIGSFGAEHLNMHP